MLLTLERRFLSHLTHVSENSNPDFYLSHLGVKGGDEAGGVVVHKLYEHGEHIPQVGVLLHGGQVVQDALQLIFLHSRPYHHQLLYKAQDVGPARNYQKSNYEN